jgi:hypothetical protein
MTVQTATELERLGILPAGSWKKAGGTRITMLPGYDIKGVEDIKSGDLPKFFLETLGPAIRAHVGDDNVELMQESYKLFGQQTGQRLGLLFLQNEAQRQRDVNLRHGVDPRAAIAGINDKDFGANLDNLGASIRGFAQVVGAPAIPNAIAGLHLLTDAMHGLTQTGAEHPTIANAIATGISPLIWGAAYAAVKDIYNHLPSMSGTQAAAHPGRDPRSPSVWPYAYVPPSSPPVITVTPVVVPPATAHVVVYVDGALAGSSSGNSPPPNSSFDHDGRMGFAGPDVRN